MIYSNFNVTLGESTNKNSLFSKRDFEVDFSKKIPLLVLTLKWTLHSIWILITKKFIWNKDLKTSFLLKDVFLNLLKFTQQICMSLKSSFWRVSSQQRA